MQHLAWQKKISLDILNARGKGTSIEHMGIKITQVTETAIFATMPVDSRTKQPAGILHGGASVFLAESVGSLAANMMVDDYHYCVGQEINANHLKAVTSGIVTAKAIALHLGKKSHVWSIEITDDKNRLICISRLTMAVLPKP